MIAQSQYRREFIIRKWSLGSHPHLGFHLGKMALTVPQQENRPHLETIMPTRSTSRLLHPKEFSFNFSSKKVFFDGFSLNYDGMLSGCLSHQFSSKSWKKRPNFFEAFNFQIPNILKWTIQFIKAHKKDS